VTPCAQLTAATCMSQNGCNWQGGPITCTGNLTPCNALATQAACQSVSGCFWQ
jgi:hypothetical protein